MTEPTFHAPSVESMNERLDAYEFVEIIDSGAHDALYVASQKSLDRHVAVRVFSPELSADEDFQKGFEGMARRMARLNHANLIGVFNSGTAGDMLYLVMEFVKGRSLEQSLGGKPLPLAQALTLIGEVCKGLAHAHQNQVQHAGLSPKDILLNDKQQPKVGNFGFSYFMPGSLERPSARFIAPELVDGSGQLSSRSDVYSLGAILYELVTGQPHGPEAIPPQLISKPNEKIEPIWRKATAADPAQRHASVEEFQQACQKAASRRQPAAAAVPAAARAPLSAGAVPASPAAAVPIVDQVGANWKLWRNLVVIALLCVAIYLAWNRYQGEKLKREKHTQEMIEEKKRREEERKAYQAKLMVEKKERWQEMQKPEPKPEPKPEEVVEAPPENPFEGLERLRERLAAGERGEFPAGTKGIGGGHYFFVKEPMSWPAAAAFARKFGAHLVIPNADATLAWLSSNLMAGTADAIWIGAAKSSRSAWTLADGRAWLLAQPPEGDGEYVAATPQGDLIADGYEVTRPFILQWHNDGSNPGSIENLLDLTRASIANGSPVYPPGTHAYGVRHYLYVAQPMDWNRAAAMAEQAGGHLMVPRGISETFNLEKMAGELKAENGIWLGGHHQGSKWSWVTGEPWGRAKWSGGVEPTLPGSALVIHPGRGWQAKDRDKEASGFIIEWSHDAATTASR